MKIVYKIIIIVLLIIILFNVFSQYNISVLGFRNFKISSGSMEPNLKVNDIILVKKCSNYNLNDIITYKSGNEFITHRIVKIDGNKVITRGDANNTNDSPIKKDNIVGKVVYRFKILGFIFYLFKNPLILILTFILGIFITVFIPDKKKGA